jgi:hypothetical protein
VFLSWLRPRRKTHKRPATFRPMLESLDERIVPANPHFIFATSSVDGNGALVVNFKEAGLGDNQNIDYTVTGDQNASFAYMNNGGNTVQGTPFNAVDTTLASGTFTSGKNGQITATLTSAAPSPSADDLKIANGNGWKLITDITYTNLALNDTTNGVSTTVPDAEFHSVTPVVK